MWFTFVTARLFVSVSFQPRLVATLLTSRSVVNSPTQRVGLSPTFRSASLAQHSCNSCKPAPAGNRESPGPAGTLPSFDPLM